MVKAIDLTPILQALIALLAAVITWKVVPWIQAKTTAEQERRLRALIDVLVVAAEALYGAGHGAEKLEYVCTELRARGFAVDLAAIERTVYEEFNRGKEDGETGDLIRRCAPPSPTRRET